MRSIWITRHGTREDFENPEWFKDAERPYDPPLSDRGFAEAGRLGERLAGEGIAHIFSSPFLRCVQTAHQVATRLNLTIKLESGLSEWLSGEWFPSAPKILAVSELADHFSTIDQNYASQVPVQYPETRPQLWERTYQIIRFLVRHYPGDLLLVGHGASVLGVAAGLLQESPDDTRHGPQLELVPYCCLTKLVGRDGEWSMELCADTAHLGERGQV